MASLLGLCTVLGIAFWLYFPSLKYPFLSIDDPIYITSQSSLHKIANGQNEGWQELLSPQEALKKKQWDYLPTRALSYGLDAMRGGMRPLAFRQTSLALFLGTLFFIWLFLGQLGLPPHARTLATLSLSLHPLMVEPTIWMSSRKDILMGFFTCAALSFAAQSLQSHPKKDGILQPRFWAWGLTLVCTLAAASSKGPGVLSFLFVVIFLFYQGGLPALRERKKSILLVSSILFIWLFFSLWYGKTVGIQSTISLWKKAFHALGMPLWALLRYLFPIGLSVDYSQSFTYRVWWQDPFSWCTLLFLVFGGLRWWKKTLPREVLWFFVIWSLCIAPYSGIVSVAQHHADRFLLFNNLFGSIVLGFWLSKKRIAIFFVMLWISFWGWQSYHYIPQWKSDLSLSSHVYRQSPNTPYALYTLGQFAFRQKKYDISENLARNCLRTSKKVFSCWILLFDTYIQRILQSPKNSRERAKWLARAEETRKQTLHYATIQNYQRGHFNWGEFVLAWLKGDLVTAEKALHRTLQRSTPPQQTLRTLLQLLLQQQRRTEAKNLLVRYGPSFSSDPWIRGLLKQIKKNKDPFVAPLSPTSSPASSQPIPR